MKKGFTLIELLAVIVILAIIALIAVPIVLGIINDSKKSSEKESLNLYTDTVEKTITKKQMNNPSFNPDKCEIKDKGNLECFSGSTSLGIVEIEMKGQVPSSGTVIIEGNNIKYENILLNDKTYYEKEGNVKLISDADNDGKISYGDKYAYKVNDTDTFYFYVLFIEEDKVNLIMDRNICEDGTVATESNTCTVAWHAGADNNNYGPDTAMTYLYNGTKNWSNVPNIELTYTDENNSGTINGYTGITTDNGVATITGKNGAPNTTIGTEMRPLKARIPMEIEVSNVGCDGGYRSCPNFLVENLDLDSIPTYKSEAIEKYSNLSRIPGIIGYWLLSSNQGDSNRVMKIEYDGSKGSGWSVYSNLTTDYGIRPVITVSKSDLN